MKRIKRMLCLRKDGKRRNEMRLGVLETPDDIRMMRKREKDRITESRETRRVSKRKVESTRESRTKMKVIRTIEKRFFEFSHSDGFRFRGLNSNDMMRVMRRTSENDKEILLRVNVQQIQINKFI